MQQPNSHSSFDALIDVKIDVSPLLPHASRWVGIATTLLDLLLLELLDLIILKARHLHELAEYRIL